MSPRRVVGKIVRKSRPETIKKYCFCQQRMVDIHIEILDSPVAQSCDEPGRGNCQNRECKWHNSSLFFGKDGGKDCLVG